eukprot:comp21976_c0_seq1/m.50311 comp21976_c0_seq1/g.50311  ORF comp21976_c0_seq1/g.50311 comp21976_c0_seq1/m.50311 type:complete len:308 (+) comp21976_c0_seq1:512-1435(+)
MHSHCQPRRSPVFRTIWCSTRAAPHLSHRPRQHCCPRSRPTTCCPNAARCPTLIQTWPHARCATAKHAAQSLNQPQQFATCAASNSHLALKAATVAMRRHRQKGVRALRPSLGTSAAPRSSDVFPVISQVSCLHQTQKAAVALRSVSSAPSGSGAARVLRFSQTMTVSPLGSLLMPQTALASTTGSKHQQLQPQLPQRHQLQLKSQLQHPLKHLRQHPLKRQLQLQLKSQLQHLLKSQRQHQLKHRHQHPLKLQRQLLLKFQLQLQRLHQRPQNFQRLHQLRHRRKTQHTTIHRRIRGCFLRVRRTS